MLYIMALSSVLEGSNIDLIIYLIWGGGGMSMTALSMISDVLPSTYKIYRKLERVQPKKKVSSVVYIQIQATKWYARRFLLEGQSSSK